MGSSRMKIRVIRAYGPYKRGQEFDWQEGGFSRLMLKQGFVERVLEEQEIETASIQQRTRKAARK